MVKSLRNENDPYFKGEFLEIAGHRPINFKKIELVQQGHESFLPSSSHMGRLDAVSRNRIDTAIILI